jgi:hypothetical protein
VGARCAARLAGSDFQPGVGELGSCGEVLARRYRHGMAHIVQLDQSTIFGARNHGGRVSHLVVQPFPQPQPLQGMGVNWVTFAVQSLKPSVRWRMEFWPTWYEQRT